MKRTIAFVIAALCFLGFFPLNGLGKDACKQVQKEVDKANVQLGRAIQRNNIPMTETRKPIDSKEIDALQKVVKMKQGKRNIACKK
jgi:hypothetical protein